jgi:hypothetical protein
MSSFRRVPVALATGVFSFSPRDPLLPTHSIQARAVVERLHLVDSLTIGAAASYGQVTRRVSCEELPVRALCLLGSRWPRVVLALRTFR